VISQVAAKRLIPISRHVCVQSLSHSTALLFSRFADEITNVYGNFVMYLLFVFMLSELFGNIITPKFMTNVTAQLPEQLVCRTETQMLDCKPLLMTHCLTNAVMFDN